MQLSRITLLIASLFCLGGCANPDTKTAAIPIPYKDFVAGHPPGGGLSVEETNNASAPEDFPPFGGWYQSTHPDGPYHPDATSDPEYTAQ